MQKQQQLLRTATILMTMLATAGALAEGEEMSGVLVDSKNGNLSVRTIDATWSGTSWDIRADRTYNSLSDYAGYFGPGWCTNFETRMFELPEGNAIVIECGAGQAVLYGPLADTDEQIRNTVNSWEGMIKDTEGKRADAVRARLMYDHPFRRTWASARKILFQAAPLGRLYEHGRGRNYLIKTANGYELHEGEEVKSFDAGGRQVKRTDRRGRSMTFQYADGRLVRVKADGGADVSVKWNKDGLIEEIGNSASTVRYIYSNKRLVKVEAAGKTVQYGYSSDGKLASYMLETGNTVKFEMDKTSSRVSRLVHAGCTETMIYPKSFGVIGTYRVMRKMICKDHAEKSHIYEYAVRTNPMGTRRILASSRVIDEEKIVEVDYHPIFQRPTRVKDGREEIRYTFGADGRVTKLSIGDYERKFEYETACGKISRVEDLKGFHRFSYNAQCDLSQADTPDGRLTMRYDDKGRIVAISDTRTGKAALISYESRFGKPAMIESPGQGKMFIRYKPDGEIDKVDSPSGNSMALQISSIFNSLLDAISPATADTYGMHHSQIGQNCRCSVESFIESP